MRGVAGELPREAARQHRGTGAARARGAGCARTSASRSRSIRASRSARGWAARRRRRWPRWWRRTRCCQRPCERLELLKFAMRARRSRAAHAMSTTSRPSLFGGLVLTVGIDQPRVKQIPVPRGDARRDRPPAHVPRHQQGARDPQAQRGAVGFRLADRQPRRLHLRLLHQRSRHDPRLVRGRGDRAAAPGADPGISRGAPRGDGGRSARLLHLRRRTLDVRLGAKRASPRRCWRPCSARSPRGSSAPTAGWTRSGLPARDWWSERT